MHVYIWLEDGTLLCRGNQLNISPAAYGGDSDEILIGNCVIVNQNDHTDNNMKPHPGLFCKKKNHVFQTMDDAITHKHMNTAALRARYDAEINDESDLIRFLLRHNCTGESCDPIARAVAIEYAVYFTGLSEKEISV